MSAETMALVGRSFSHRMRDDFMAKSKTALVSARITEARGRGAVRFIFVAP
jgi:hypothetical protein